MTQEQEVLKIWLDSIVPQVENSDYIPTDPVQFLHAFEEKQDIEIVSFFSSIMAWGNRIIVNNKLRELFERMNGKPYAFIRTFSESTWVSLQGFKHRTFKDEDFYWLCSILKDIFEQYGSLENFWLYVKRNSVMEHFVQDFHRAFFSMNSNVPTRCRKHIADGRRGSTCKRLLLNLRWLVRKNSVVDVGLYTSISPAELIIPFDVHVARISRRLHLLDRVQDDWKALQELHKTLFLFDPEDPAKYDYALFGLGIRPELFSAIPKEIQLTEK